MKIYGIRHHGPGSSKSLLKALDEQQPDCLLIEGPPDADALIKHVSNEGLKPPVALLVYNPKDLSQASYFPFADFSPEWQAMQWGLKKGISTIFMDLPIELSFGLDKKENLLQLIDFEQDTDEEITENDENTDLSRENREGGIDEFEAKIKNPKLKIERDPLSYMATLAGYSDSERWWEITFEQSDNSTEIFESIIDMMAALREGIGRTESDETLMREAYMRKLIRKAEKDGFQNIAVVCGAWHAPVLHNIDNFKEKTDNDILKGLKKVPTATTWVPWSYDRLSRDSGYAAGIISPAWYELLFGKRSNATVRWMTKAARLLRKEDLSASSAHSIEAVRLAETLAILRGRSIAGMDELEEAALCIFCDGYDAPMRLIREKLIIGDVIGRVPPEIPQVPLQRDMEAAIKTARLSKEYATSEAVTKELDLRKETNLFASHLLHRLTLLGIPWGKTMKGSRYQLGSFKEIWKLQWKPDYAIRIIDAAQWGNTVEEAAINFVVKKAQNITDLPDLTDVVDKAINADLRKAIPSLLKRLQELSALTEDVLLLMDALPSLVNIVKYGNVRSSDRSAVDAVLQELLPRIFIGLPTACINTDDEHTTLIFNKLQNINRAINLLNQPQNTEGWLRVLQRLATLQNVHGLLVGISVRILFDKNIFTIHQTTTYMRYALSQGNEPKRAAAWLEGFLNGSGILLIHHEALWRILDEWVDELDMERLLELLPVLRRTFSEFAPPERQKMLALAQRNDAEGAPQYFELSEDIFYDKKRGEKVLATVQGFL
jgi:Family of unknown function (DUF5682)